MAGKLNRRRFIQSAAAVTAAPWFVPSSAFGANERINLAHIGIGGQGGYHLSLTTKMPDVQVVAVCDVDANHLARAKGVVEAAYAADKASGSYKGCDAYGDFRDIIARKDIDACLIAAPDHWHGVMTVAALKSGKDCYTEKPLAYSVGESRAIANAAQRYGRVLQTGSHERANARVRFVADLVRNGYLGKIKHIEVSQPVTNHSPIPKQTPTQPPAELNYEMWLGPAPFKPYFFSETKDPNYGKNYQRCHFFFRYQLDYATGEISDRGAHILDLCQLVLGVSDSGPVEVSGKGVRDTVGEFDSFMKYDYDLKYENGVTLHGTSEGTDATRGLKIHGEEGWINVHVHGCDLTASDPKLLEVQLKPSDETCGRSPGHHKDFFDAIRSRGATLAPAEFGHRSASICHLLNIAMLLERPLKWDPVKEKVKGDDQANSMLTRTLREPWSL